MFPVYKKPPKFDDLKSSNKNKSIGLLSSIISPSMIYIYIYIYIYIECGCGLYVASNALRVENRNID